MVLYARLHRDQEEQVRYSDGIAGEIDCIECDGTGVWTVLPDGEVIKCTSCKSTGKMLISF